MDNIVALDIGTTGVKAALVDRRGQIVASAYAGYPTYTDGNRIEQEPEAWWRATGEALAALWREMPGARSVAGVALSGQMQDAIPRQQPACSPSGFGWHAKLQRN